MFNSFKTIVKEALNNDKGKIFLESLRKQYLIGGATFSNNKDYYQKGQSDLVLELLTIVYDGRIEKAISDSKFLDPLDNFGESGE